MTGTQIVMQIGHIRVQNYRSLKDVEASFSSFACIIGENNAGKSSLLQAFISFLSGSKLEMDDYYDVLEDISICVRFDDVTDRDLELLAEEHRTRILAIIHEGSLNLVRRFPAGEKSALRCLRMLPKECRFHSSEYTSRLKGKTGQELHNLMVAEYPEVVESAPSSIRTQKLAKELIEEYVAKLSTDQVELGEADLPSGIPSSITGLFPEPIYVAAVKDLSDEVKTNQQATFGKLLGVLLEAIEPELNQVEEIFQELQSRLNRSVTSDGTEVDNRLDDVKRIENMVQQHLQETFSNVQLQLNIPPPEVKMILSNADLEIDDGVKGDAESKGDGLRRAITFAIFRTYAQLSSRNTNDDSSRKNRFLFLFEEPELFLHPTAQNILFDALKQISNRHQVVISTHSPYFFQPDSTGQFIKVRKVNADPKPVGELMQPKLVDVRPKDLFQLISFETSNTAFFARKVVLVEGDSELIALPHIASLLNEEWDFARAHVIPLKVGGKGNISRFKNFFEAFDVPVIIIADLDILTSGFDQLGVIEETRQLQSSLLQKAKDILDISDTVHGLVGLRRAKKNFSRGDQRSLWAEVESDYKDYRHDETKIGKLIESFESFVEALRVGDRRLDIIAGNGSDEVRNLKHQLLANLRHQQIIVWERGCLEDYYPDAISANVGKLEQALEFCEHVSTRTQVLELSELVPLDHRRRTEFELVFSSIFGETADNVQDFESRP